MKLVSGEANRVAFELASKIEVKNDEIIRALDKVAKARTEEQLESRILDLEQLVFEKTGKWLYEV